MLVQGVDVSGRPDSDKATTQDIGETHSMVLCRLVNTQEVVENQKVVGGVNNWWAWVFLILLIVLITWRE